MARTLDLLSAIYLMYKTKVAMLFNVCVAASSTTQNTKWMMFVSHLQPS